MSTSSTWPSSTRCVGITTSKLSAQGHAKNASDQGVGNVQAVRSDPAVAQAELELRTLLERFANNKSMQPILDAVNQIYVDAQNDEELKRWFKRADSYLRRVLQEPGYVMKDECDREGRALRDDGQSFFSDKYRGHREELFNSIKDFTLAVRRARSGSADAAVRRRPAQQAVRRRLEEAHQGPPPRRRRQSEV